MSWTDEELDQLFSDAASNATVEYNDAYWKDIEGMLPVRKKRKGLLWWMGGAGALVFFGTLLLVQVPFASKSTVANQAVRELPNSNATEMENELTSTASNQVVKSANSSESQTEITDNKKNVPANQAVLQNTVRNEASIGKVQPTTGIQQNMKSIEATYESFDLVENSENTIESQGLINPNMVKEEISNVNQPNEMVSEDISSLATNDLKSLIPASELMPTNYKLKSRSPHALYAEVAAGMGQSPILSNKNGSPIAQTYGINLGYTYQKTKWKFSAGIGMSLQQMDNVYIKERSIIYGFGASNFDNHYRFSSIARLETPISIGYQFKRHTVMAGMSVSFPIVAGVSYTKYIDGETAISEHGYTSTEFFKPFGAEIQLGYMYQIGSNWELGAKVQMQLINPIASDRIIGKTSALPLNGQVLLRKSIVLKK